MSLNETTDAAFADDVLASTLPVLVEFTADWCPPCKTIAPVLEQIAETERDRLRVVALDVDTNPETTRKYQVMGMPTLALFVSGEVVTQVMGARPRSAILRELEPHLAQAASSIG
ncbi:thioredoxin family protein [Glycomyces paridis]|uniref:Thioredoxin n=1 Tax=Glycomyces paridis TaxID=2126555 RepID=A0A4S8PHE5_9ACTN|nr:thioredoxin domain-containing protein [Glycomyces paridis]THV30027.1 thiol reductase thioredoxin [Glycomyces paridis]